MSSRVPYELAQEKSESKVKDSQHYGGKSYRQALIEDNDFFMDNPFNGIILFVTIMVLGFTFWISTYYVTYFLFQVIIAAIFCAIGFGVYVYLWKRYQYGRP